jgi:cytochrome oxidase Cu insertion factor (SCO1/SenC/PrrC family)
MRREWKTRYTVLIASLAALLILAGCSGGDEKSTPAVTPAFRTPTPTAVTATVRQGQQAPDFTVRAADGREITLSKVLQEKQAVVLVFYRGFF